MLIIGLTGENCAGKTTVGKYLAEKYDFHFFSLSDMIREELRKEGLEASRENMIKKGNELRRKHGAGILGRLARERIMEKAGRYVVDSIRNPEEVRELRKLKNFYLLYITAPPEIRFRRMKERGREGDPKTFQEFLEIEEKEKKGKKEEQNLEATASMADVKIVNDGNLEKLYKKIDELMEKLIPQSQQNDP